MKNQRLDTSNEFHLCRYRNGITLIRPEQINKSFPYGQPLGYTVNDLLRHSFCVYFSDTETTNINLNETTAVSCGYSSLQTALNKTLHEVYDKRSVENIIRNNLEVIKSKKTIIIEATALQKNQINVSTLSIKIPWYHNDNIIGLLGCSIVLGKQALVESLSQIRNLGLLEYESHTLAHICGREIDNLYFSKRELQCIQLTLKGYPAKKAAFTLGLSQRTVEEYLDNIKIKLGVHSKSEMIEKLWCMFRLNIA